MSDIKMSEFFDLPYQPTTETVNREIVNTLIDLNGKPAEAAAHAINTHDDLVKKVAELKEALVEVSEQTIDLFSYTIDKENYYSGHIYDCLVNDEVETIRLMVKAALKESEK